MTQTTTRVGTSSPEPHDRPQTKPVRRTFVLAIIVALIVSACFGMFLKLHKVPGSSGQPNAAVNAAATENANNGPSKNKNQNGPATGVNATGTPSAVTALPPVAGATKLVSIVPVGYSDNQAGAVAAATNYLTTLYGSTKILNDVTRAQVIAAIAQPGGADSLAASIDPTVAIIKSSLLDGQGKPLAGGVLTLRVLLAGYRVDSFTTTKAVVEIWYEAIYGVAVGNSPAPVQSNYAVDTITLTWANGDWKWDTSTETPGPTPLGVANGSAADTTRMQNVLTTFQPYVYGAGQ